MPMLTRCWRRNEGHARAGKNCYTLQARGLTCGLPSLPGISHAANPAALDDSSASTATKATSPPPPPWLRWNSGRVSQSSKAKNTVSWVWALGGVRCSCRTRRHFFSPRPKVLDDKSCNSVNDERGEGRLDK